MRIGKLRKTRENNHVKYAREISLSSEKKDMWICIDEAFAQYFCEDRIDGYLVALLLRALKEGEDIEAEDAVSETLLFQLEKYLIPYLCKLNTELKPVKIKCNTLPDINTLQERVTATGISCGVDSLSTLIYHTGQERYSSRNINCLTLFNAGYYGEGNNSSELFKKYVVQSEDFCREHGFKFLVVDSNVYDFSAYHFLSMHTYLSCSLVLMLQNGISNYYYASGYPVFDFKNEFKDPAYYDLFLLQCLSTRGLQFISSCSTMARVEKIELVLQKPSYAKHLYVCLSGKLPGNCSVCEKCMRTLLAADSMGKVELLENSFDVALFYKKRNLFLGYMLRNKRKNVFYREIYQNYRKHGRKIQGLAYFAYFIPIKQDFLQLKNRMVKRMPEGLVKKLKEIRDNFLKG